MTKRASGAFKRNARDFYPTPRVAVLPLLPFLHRDNVRTFVEPCYGWGDLTRHLEGLGLKCVEHGDIESGWDARNWCADDFRQADATITNPPWEHELMASIMERHACHVPAWFLVSSDWLFTKQSATLVAELCTDVVPIGRLKWVPDTKHTGFDNCAWVRMHKAKDTGAARLWPQTMRVM